MIDPQTMKFVIVADDLPQVTFRDIIENTDFLFEWVVKCA